MNALRARDGDQCRGCGAHLMFTHDRTDPALYATVDHVHPSYAGGTNELSNLQLLCTRCNSTKGTKWVGPRSLPAGGLDGYKVSLRVRIPPASARALESHAAALSMSVSGLVAALVDALGPAPLTDPAALQQARNAARSASQRGVPRPRANGS